MSVYSHASEEAIICMLILVDRVIQTYTTEGYSAATSLSIHRIILAGLVVAIKVQDDIYLTNSYYARCGGVRLQELNRLEAEFANLLGFNFHVSH